eukprot:c20700_g1_i1 orf=1387-3735(+)
MATSPVQQVEKAKVEHIVVQFFTKALHIILESRIPFSSSQIPSGLKNATRSLASSSSSMGQRTRDCWFNLSLGDYPAPWENLELGGWSILQPMVIDVLLVQHKAVGGNSSPISDSLGQQVSRRMLSSGGKTTISSSSGDTDRLHGTMPGIVLERWVVQYDWLKKSFVGSGSGLKVSSAFKGGGSGDDKRGSSSGMRKSEALLMRGGDGALGSCLTLQGDQGSFLSQGKGEAAAMVGIWGFPPPMHSKHVIELPAVYKKTIIMLRSLYCRTRLLPAYRLFRLANSSSHPQSFSLSYRVSSSPSPLPAMDEKDMTPYSFTPIDTPYGRMCLSVTYRHTAAVMALEETQPILHQIISDYVGSPATDPLKTFSADSHFTGTRVVHVVSLPSSVPSSPSTPSFARRHSWSGGVNKRQPTIQPSPSPSFGVGGLPSHSPPLPPSPYPSGSGKHMPSDHCPSPLSTSSQSSFPSSIQSPYVYQKGDVSQPINIEGHCTPPFSPSPSPSPPASYTQDMKVCRGRSGSAPVNIPKPSLSHSPRPFFSHSPKLIDLHQQSRRSLPPPSPRRRSETLKVLSSKPKHLTGQLTTSGGSLSDRKALVGHVKADTVPLSGGKNPLHFHPCLGLPGASSKASGYDGDDEFSCPFAVDNDEAEEQHISRVDSPKLSGRTSKSSDSTGLGGIVHQRSQDAAVGVLIQMLKSAPPLRSCSVGTSLDFPEKCEVTRENSLNPVISMTHEPCTTSLQPSLESFYSRKTTDALVELQTYKDMRDCLHSQSGEKAIKRFGSAVD